MGYSFNLKSASWQQNDGNFGGKTKGFLNLDVD